MRNLLKPIAVLVVVLAVLVMGYFSVIKAQDPTSYANPCTRYDKAVAALESELAMTPGQSGRDSLETRIAEVWQQKADDANCNSTEASPTPSPTPEATPTEEPSAEPSATPTVTVENEEYPHFFYFDQGKRKARDFGPGVTGTDQEVFDEFTRRMHLDPALLCANGSVILGDHPGDSLMACTKILMSDTNARDSYEERVRDAIQTMTVADKAAGVVTSAYMVEVNGIPSTILIEGVHRPEVYRILRLDLNDGRTVELRLDCGFQWDFSAEKVEKPKTNIPVAEDCLNGGTRDKDGQCPEPKPEHAPSKAPTPEPSVTPSESPGPSPAPTPSETETPEPSEPPSLEPKSSNPADYKHETGAPKAEVTTPAQAKPDPVVTETTGGSGVIDTPTKAPGSESGVTAPGASPAPTMTQEPAAGANTPEPSATTCVPAPGKSEC